MSFLPPTGQETPFEETGPDCPMDMFGLAGMGLAIVLALIGWATGRFAMLISSAVLVAAAVIHNTKFALILT